MMDAKEEKTLEYYVKIKNGAPEAFRQAIDKGQYTVNRSKRELSIFDNDDN